MLSVIRGSESKIKYSRNEDGDFDTTIFIEDDGFDLPSELQLTGPEIYRINARQGDEYDRLPERRPNPFIADQQNVNKRIRYRLDPEINYVTDDGYSVELIDDYNQEFDFDFDIIDYDRRESENIKIIG